MYMCVCTVHVCMHLPGLQVLQDCNMKDLESLWMTVEELFSLRRQRVAAFEDSCDELEKTRTAMVRYDVKLSFDVLLGISYHYWS